MLIGGAGDDTLGGDQYDLGYFSYEYQFLRLPDFGAAMPIKVARKRHAERNSVSLTCTCSNPGDGW